MGLSALTLTLLAHVNALERNTLVSQLLATSSRSTDFLHSSKHSLKEKGNEGARSNQIRQHFGAHVPTTQLENDPLSRLDLLPALLHTPPEASWRQHTAEQNQDLAKDPLGELDLLPELLNVDNAPTSDQLKLQSRQNRVSRMVKALKDLQKDALRNQERLKTSRRASYELISRTSQALLSVASSIYKRDPKADGGSGSQAEDKESNANQTDANATANASNHASLPVPVDDSKYGESTVQGWIKTVFVIIGIGLFIGGMVVYCLVPLALKIIKPYRPRSEAESKKFLEDLMSQRTELETQQTDLDKEMEALSKEIEEEKEKISAQSDASGSDAESDKDKTDSGKDREAEGDPEASEEPMPPPAPRRSTRRSTIKLQRGSVPVLLPDGTYAVPEEKEQPLKSRMEQVTEVLNPLLSKREEIENKLTERKAQLAQKSRQLIIEEIQGATAAIADAATPNAEDVFEFSAADMPPVALLLAGLCVPVQLKSLWLTCIANLSAKVILWILSCIALIVDYSTPCWTLSDTMDNVGDALGGGKVSLVQNSWIYPWMQIDVLSLIFQITVHCGVLVLVNRTLKEVDEIGDQALNGPQPEGTLEALRVMLDAVLASCGKSMAVYDHIVSSWPFWLMSFAVFFDFGWQIYGLTFVLSTPSTYCDANVMRFVFRLRGLTFLLMLAYHFSVLVNAAGTLMIRNPQFTEALIERAHDIDEDFSPPWLPLCTMFVRAFLVRDESDMDKMQLKILRAEKRKYDHEYAAVVGQEEALKGSDEVLKTKIELLEQPVPQEEKVHFITEQRNKLEHMLDKIEKLLRKLQTNEIIKEQVENQRKEAEISRGLAQFQKSRSEQGTSAPGASSSTS